MDVTVLTALLAGLFSFISPSVFPLEFSPDCSTSRFRSSHGNKFRALDSSER
jgi:hypothetical protein